MATVAGQPLRGTGNGTSEGLPTVAVHDLVIHPRDRELVIGTHGARIYVMDVRSPGTIRLATKGTSPRLPICAT